MVQLRHIELEVSADHVATITLNRPPVNALGREIREELVWTFDSLHDRDDVRVIILTGRGKVFCAGADIKEKRAMSDEPGTYVRANRLIREAFYCMMECCKPVIAAVNGPALGAGFAMASCCDMVLAADHAVFAMPEIDVGLAGGAGFMQRILPSAKARRLMLTGERITAAELYRLGVLEEVLPLDKLMPAALDLARKIAAKSPIAVRLIKDSFGMVENLPLRDGYRLEQNVTVALSKTADAREAQRAFVEKRKPVFTGR
ncbi:MAG: enoyl-CoA hydratase/isomerase family protein [Nevskiales bacterium]